MLIIGIDPGLHGALAVLEDGKFREVHDTPTFVTTGTRREYDLHAMKDLLRSVRTGEVIAGLEQLHPMPKSKSGPIGGFKLGRGSGVWEGMLVALEFPVERVSPQRWKRALALPVGHKEGSIARARELFPDAPLTLKKHDGRADAILIAECVRRRVGG